VYEDGLTRMLDTVTILASQVQSNTQKDTRGGARERDLVFFLFRTHT
jgi:hypothetical protein